MKRILQNPQNLLKIEILLKVDVFYRITGNLLTHLDLYPKTYLNSSAGSSTVSSSTLNKL